MTLHRSPLPLPQETFLLLLFLVLALVYSWYGTSSDEFTTRVVCGHYGLAQRTRGSGALHPALGRSDFGCTCRSVNLCEQLITVLRVQEIADRELFVALDTSEESLRETCQETFGIDSSKGFAHKRELAKLSKLGITPKYTAIPRSRLIQLRGLTVSRSPCCVLIGKLSCSLSRTNSVLIFTTPYCRRKAISKVSKSVWQPVNSELNFVHKSSAFGNEKIKSRKNRMQNAT